MNDQDKEMAIGIACKFWRLLNAGEWDAAHQLLAEDFEATWPQTREKITGPDDFIALNKRSPAKGAIQTIDHRYGYDRWEHNHEVTTTSLIKWEKPSGSMGSFYRISFFVIDRDGLIQSATEFWAEPGAAPK